MTDIRVLYGTKTLVEFNLVKFPELKALKTFCVKDLHFICKSSIELNWLI